MNTKIIIIGASVIAIAITSTVYLFIKPTPTHVTIEAPKVDVDALINRPQSEIDAEKHKILKAREKFKKSQGQ